MFRNTDFAELFAHWAVFFLLFCVGGVCCVTLVIYGGGHITFELIGNQFDILTNRQAILLYGMLSVVVLHFVTRGWWLREFYHELVALIELHDNAVNRYSRLKAK